MSNSRNHLNNSPNRHSTSPCMNHKSRRGCQPPTAAVKLQAGFALMEALVGILMFSIGVLGMVALQALAITSVGDSRQRMEAVYFVNQLLGQMWADDRMNLARYAHHAVPDPAGLSSPSCAFTGAASTYANVSNWLTALRDPQHGLQGLANDAETQIIVTPDAPVAGTTSVSITVCWKTKVQDTTWHNHTVIATISNS